VAGLVRFAPRVGPKSATGYDRKPEAAATITITIPPVADAAAPAGFRSAARPEILHTVPAPQDRWSPWLLERRYAGNERQREVPPPGSAA